MTNYKIQDGAVCRDLTTKENAEMLAGSQEADREYWLTVGYDDAVDAEIRKRYSLSQELAIQRQRDEKPEEFARYFEYCEECKTFVKTKKAEHA